MATEDQELLVLAAEGITVNSTSPAVVMITLFRPTQSTVQKLNSLEYNTRIAGIELRDKFDDGTWDTHINKQAHRFLSVQAEEGRKQKMLHATFFRP